MVYGSVVHHGLTLDKELSPLASWHPTVNRRRYLRIFVAESGDTFLRRGAEEQDCNFVFYLCG